MQDETTVLLRSGSIEQHVTHIPGTVTDAEGRILPFNGTAAYPLSGTCKGCRKPVTRERGGTWTLTGDAQ